MSVCVVCPIQRTVSYDGSNVDFGNPLYSTMNDNKIDTTPAHDDTDKNYMPEVGEVSHPNPYFNDNLGKPPADA